MYKERAHMWSVVKVSPCCPAGLRYDSLECSGRTVACSSLYCGCWSRCLWWYRTAYRRAQSQLQRDRDQLDYGMWIWHVSLKQHTIFHLDIPIEFSEGHRKKQQQSRAIILKIFQWCQNVTFECRSEKFKRMLQLW